MRAWQANTTEISEEQLEKFDKFVKESLRVQGEGYLGMTIQLGDIIWTLVEVDKDGSNVHP